MAISCIRLMHLCIALASVATAATLPGKGFDRFLTIWLENMDYDKVRLNQHIRTLQQDGIMLSRYYAHTHPSQPNYLAAIAGDYFGLNHDDTVRIPENVTTLVDLLEDAGLSWRGYMEHIPSPGYMGDNSPAPGGGAWDYVRKHNPFVLFDSINTNGSRLLKVDSFVALSDDLAAGQLPQYAFITPNMTNDGHDTSLEFAAAWSDRFLGPLLLDDATGNNTLILLTYDESEDYGKPNHIVSLLLGSAIPPNLRGTVDDTFYTHYSILSTLEFNWDLPNLGRYDVGANVFRFVLDAAPPSASAWKNRDPPNLVTLDNSVSYPGAFHSDPASYLPIPVPNLGLLGPSGLPVSQSVRDTWASQVDLLTPYDGTGENFDAAHLPVYQAQTPVRLL